MKKALLTLSTLLIAVSVFAQQPRPQQARPQRPQNQNPPQPRPAPVFNPQKPTAHDPVMAKEGDTFYVFYTNGGIHRLASKDLKTWERLDDCFSEMPKWINELIPTARFDFWAPDIIYHDGLWHLFYACSAFGRNTSVIGHATSPTLDPKAKNYGWKDCGLIMQSVPTKTDWNAIDPNVIFDENGDPWMDFGSFWGGIMMFKMKKDLSGPALPEEWHVLSTRPIPAQGKSTGGPVEAPFIFKHGKYYYLFVSFDSCCRGASSTYKVAVGRSETVTGPYVDKDGKRLDQGGGSIILEGDVDNWAAAGHDAAYTIDGKDYHVTHAYEAGTGASRLIVNEIKWTSNDWPILTLPSEK